MGSLVPNRGTGVAPPPRGSDHHQAADLSGLRGIDLGLVGGHQHDRLQGVEARQRSVAPGLSRKSVMEKSAELTAQNGAGEALASSFAIGVQLRRVFLIASPSRTRRAPVIRCKERKRKGSWPTRQPLN